jgi:hypothetical protein
LRLTDECDVSLLLLPPASRHCAVGVLGRGERKPDIDVRNDESSGGFINLVSMGTQ